MKALVLSTSLNPASRSRILARAAGIALEEAGAEVTAIDLRDHPLPLCDGADAYQDPHLPGLKSAIERADVVLVATPVYNYDLASPAKNLVELTGQSWNDKLVGFLVAAGGQGSYMAVMAFAASLMLDFHCLIIPRFVFATGEAFDGEEIADEAVADRVRELARDALSIRRT